MLKASVCADFYYPYVDKGCDNLGHLLFD